MTRTLGVTVVALTLYVLTTSQLAAESFEPIIVSDAAGLRAALVSANAGRRILVTRGTYIINEPLVVPDGVVLDGEGVMLGRPMPDGFRAGTETRIVADPAGSFEGDLLTLGNGVTIRDLVIEDLAGRRGNVVAIYSRHPGDSLAASIVQCEIINPNVSSLDLDGPVGRAVVVLTRNRQLGAPPDPDTGAAVTATLTGSIIRSTSGGSAIFAINFAAGGNVTVMATANRVHGSVDATAGVSRPDEVTSAQTTLISQGNLYSWLAGTAPAWAIIGGSSVPVAGFVAPGASGNVNRFTSVGDRIDGFRMGIFAAAARRQNLTSDENSDNVVDLRMTELRIRTTGSGAADLILHGARAENGQYTPGNNNVLRVTMIGVTGSGTRANSYAHEQGPAGPQNLGTGNRLEIRSSKFVFGLLNPGIVPAPAAEFFLVP